MIETQAQAKPQSSEPGQDQRNLLSSPEGEDDARTDPGCSMLALPCWLENGADAIRNEPELWRGPSTGGLLPAIRKASGLNTER